MTTLPLGEGPLLHPITTQPLGEGPLLHPMTTRFRSPGMVTYHPEYSPTGMTLPPLLLPLQPVSGHPCLGRHSTVRGVRVAVAATTAAAVAAAAVLPYRAVVAAAATPGMMVRLPST